MTYHKDKRYCDYCKYEGVLPVVEYVDGKYHGTVLSLCKCNNATIEMDSNPSLIHMGTLLTWSKAINLNPDRFRIYKVDHEVARELKIDTIPF